MSQESIKRGDQLCAEADKALNNPVSFFSFSRSTDKYEKAAEFYNQAGTAYKLGKDFDKAGNAYLLSAENYKLSGDAHSANRAFIEASGAYRKNNPKKACKILLNRVIKYYNDLNNLEQSARYYKEIAGIHESMGNYRESIDMYREAVEIYKGENTPASAKTSLEKIYTLLGLHFVSFTICFIC